MADAQDGYGPDDFVRGITQPGFMPALEKLAAEPGWWREVLHDPGLILGIRDNSINVYWLGQSLFRVTCSPTGNVRASTHAKYLVDPGLRHYAAFDGAAWQLPAPTSMLIHDFTPGKTLADLKRAARIYAGQEKLGVHQIVLANTNVLDVEIAMQGVAPDLGDTKTPRVDMAALEMAGDSIHLVFWEAKTFANAELRAKPGLMPKVVKQIMGYRIALELNRNAILESYRQVARDLTRIAGMSEGRRAVSDLITRVASQPEALDMAPVPDVGLLVFDFDADQRDGKAWLPHRRRLLDALPGRFRAAGDAGTIRLTGPGSLLLG
jgi:hypothetical protein